MSTILWLIVILLLTLPVFLLVTGISNDAVNFLHPAIGSRVASRKVILAVAAVGLIVGSFFAGGMMELVRQDIINPAGFSLYEILVLFIAVSITNVIILDAFNTTGFPISTTITLIFSLIGGALAIGISKAFGGGGLAQYPGLINTDSLFLILAGILISIFASFIIGAIVQFFVRLIFSFHYHGRYNTLFALTGAIAFTCIFYLSIRQGDITGEGTQWILDQSLIISLAICFAVTLLLFMLSAFVFKAEVPNIVVLAGTFVLAMSFTSNNLVNYIGLPMTGLESLNKFLRTPGASIDDFGLAFLNTEWSQTRNISDWAYILLFLASGLIMAFTLFNSRKLQSVTNMEVYLGRQSPGSERFRPTPLSITMVRGFLRFYSRIENSAPPRVRNYVASRFELPESGREGYPDHIIYFDSLRASVNLIVSSLIVALGTHFRFPLSTTFVVFMVAMGSSFADRAWGRDSAVYRLSGVLSILGAWFITAIFGFLGAFVFTLLIIKGGIWVALVLFVAMVITLWQTTRAHRRKWAEEAAVIESNFIRTNESLEWISEAGRSKVRASLLEISKIYVMAVDGLMHENVSQLREAVNKIEALQKNIRNFKAEIFNTYSSLPEESQDSGQYFVQILDYLTALANTVAAIAAPACEHMENQHKTLTEAQKSDLTVILDEFTAFINFLIYLEKERRSEALADLKKRQNAAITLLEEYRVEQIRRIKLGKGSTRVNVIYMEIIGGTKNLLLYSYSLYQAICDFNRKLPQGRK